MLGRLDKETKKEMQFWINDEGVIEYNKTCARCKRDYKQSFRVKIHSCRKYERR